MMNKFNLAQEKTVLMVIDIQERLVPALPDSLEVIKNTNTLITVSSKLNIPIIATEQYPKGLGKTVTEIDFTNKEVSVFEKMTFSGCTDEVLTALKQLGRKKIIITGMETHVCVFQTAKDLLAQGFQVFVVEDAVCSRTEQNYRNGLSLMSAMGAVVTNTETVFFDLIKKSGTPIFKELSKLIK